MFAFRKIKNQITWVNILKKCSAHAYATNASGTTWQQVGDVHCM